MPDSRRYTIFIHCAAVLVSLVILAPFAAALNRAPPQLSAWLAVKVTKLSTGVLRPEFVPGEKAARTADAARDVFGYPSEHRGAQP